MNMTGVNEINTVRFGILSTEEILKLSVCEITSTKKTGSGSIYDRRMGAVDNSLCETCGMDAMHCNGHFGHISLNCPIIHPLYVKSVMNILRCICIDCHRLLVSQEYLELKNCSYASCKENPRAYFSKVKKVISKVNICTRCKTPQPAYRSNSAECTINMTYEDPSPVAGGKHKITVDLPAHTILEKFKEIKEEDIRLMGMDPEMTKPVSMIISVLPVLPPPGRPFVRAAGNMCDDDLSIQYIEIVKANSKLAEGIIHEGARYSKLIQTLKFRVATTFNNSAGRAKHTTNGRPVKCIKSRISGKDGQMRGNIMGRRSNQTARTVIGPDTALKNGEMSVPEAVARILTVPETVNELNKKELLETVNSGKARFIIRHRGQLDAAEVRINLDHARVDKGTRLEKGDCVTTTSGKHITIGDNSVESHDRLSHGLKMGDTLTRNGVLQTRVKTRKMRHIQIENGDVVERCLKNGDVVVLNRQPTLHKASMMAFKIFVRPGKTFRINLACTKAFNADFDGDEMNVHVAQSPEARAEIQMLSTVENNLISGQTSKMNIVIVQDGVLGSYLMTRKKSRTLTRGQFMNALMRTSTIDNYTTRVAEIKATLEKAKKSRPSATTLLSGRGLVSFILPSDFSYKKKIGKEDDEPWLEIENGVILSGCLSKASIGSAHGCIPQYIHNEYGSRRCLDFLDDLQFITNAFLEITSFSVGFKDCLPKSKEVGSTVSDTIYRCFMEAEAVESGSRNVVVRESRINAALGKAKDIGLKIAKENLDPENRFISTVTGGSKGDFFNIAQITGLLGQQNIGGKRLPLFLNNGTRTLPHYPKDPSQLTPQEKYESRGFISSSFIKGLNPREFFFHACSGREGMSDTAVGTAVSGYIQRRIVKLQEDIRIQYDGTVRDETNRIFQLKYGEHGMDPEKTLRCSGKMWFADLQRAAQKLNSSDV
jgi:DNA-directed RNA polymerase beta' subunit